MKFLEKPIRIDEQTWDKGTKPLVTISCITYNHEKFIREAIESFLMQETTFPVEINIHDDASTDGTANIIREYEKKYPFVLFNPIYQTENQYSKRKAVITKIQHERAQGKYYAICEGDDYWIDALKLQKQVTFLENNNEFILTSGGYRSINIHSGEEKINVKEVNSVQNGKNGFDFGLEDMKRHWLTKTLTVVFRTEALKFYPMQKYKYGRDIHLFYHLLKNGKGYYFNTQLGVYRIHKGGIHSLLIEKEKIRNSFNLAAELYSINKDSFSKHLYFYASYRKFIFIIKNEYEKYSFMQKAKLLYETIKLIGSFKDIKILFVPLIPSGSNINTKILNGLK